MEFPPLYLLYLHIPNLFFCPICFSLILSGLLYKPYGHAYRNYIHIPEILRLLVRIHRLNLLRPATLVWLLHKFKPLMRSPKTAVLEKYTILDFRKSIDQSHF